MEKIAERLLERFLSAIALPFTPDRRASGRARLDSAALRDIGLESYQPSLAQQMLDERRRYFVGLS
jgi:hypothetical protein